MPEKQLPKNITAFMAGPIEVPDLFSEAFAAEIDTTEPTIETVEGLSWHRRNLLGATTQAANFGRDLRDFWRAGSEDLRGSSWAKRFIAAPVLGASAIAMAADIPLHETYIANIGSHVYTDTHGSTLATGLANGVASLGVEGLISTGVVVGLSTMPKLTDAIYKKFIRKDRGEELGGVVDTGTYALSYGSGAYIFKRHNEKNQGNLKKDMVSAAGAVGFLGTVNMGIGSGAAKLLNLGIEHPDIRWLATDTVDALKSPLTWIGFIAGRVIIKKHLKHLKHRRSLKQVEGETVALSIDAESEELFTHKQGLLMVPAEAEVK